LKGSDYLDAVFELIHDIVEDSARIFFKIQEAATKVFFIPSRAQTEPEGWNYAQWIYRSSPNETFEWSNGGTFVKQWIKKHGESI
jgi:hypothetical protein